MLDYEPMTEEQIDKYGLLERGDYKFKVVSAKDGHSQKTGLPQIEAGLRVYAPDGNRAITIYLSTNGQYMLRMLRHFCESANLMEAYNAKKICAATILSSEGICSIDIEIGKERTDGKSGNYPNKNVVTDYLKSSDKVAEVKPTLTQDNTISDDEIPF